MVTMTMTGWTTQTIGWVGSCLEGQGLAQRCMVCSRLRCIRTQDDLQGRARGSRCSRGRLLLAWAGAPAIAGVPTESINSQEYWVRVRGPQGAHLAAWA